MNRTSPRIIDWLQHGNRASLGLSVAVARIRAARLRSLARGVALVLVAQFLLLTLLSHGASAAVPDDVHTWLEEVSASGVPAIAVVVTRGDQVEVETGAGSVGGRPVDEHTSFRIASLSKSFTATAVMQLVEAERIALDTPVVEYLPDLHIDDARAATITVRELLNQSSGLTDASLGFDQYRAGPQFPREAASLLTHSSLDFDPGTDWTYSNPNYWICAWLVEEVSGMDLATYLDRKILDPLGMTETRSAATSGQVGGAPGRAHAYGVPVPVTAPDYMVAGTGGMTSTAHDMGIWLRFQHGALPGSNRVLSPEMRDEMHRRQAPEGGLYALGWYSGPPADGGVERVSHSGVGAGTGAYQGLFPNKVGVAVLQASSAPAPYTVAAALYDHVTGGELGEAPSAPGPGRDIVITLVILTVLALCTRGIMRSQRWAARTGRTRASFTLGLGLLMTIVGLTIPIWGSLLLGRAATWPVLFTTAPVPVIAILTGTLAIGLLTLTRLVKLIKTKNS